MTTTLWKSGNAIVTLHVDGRIEGDTWLLVKALIALIDEDASIGVKLWREMNKLDEARAKYK